MCCVFLCFVTFPNVSLSTSELRASLALCPPVKVVFYFYFGCHVCCVFLCFVTCPNGFLSTSELRASLALCPPVKVFFTDCSKAVLLLWTILLFMFRVCLVFLSVHCNLVVTCWERTEFLVVLYVMFYCVMWCPGSGVLCLIVSIVS